MSASVANKRVPTIPDIQWRNSPFATFCDAAHNVAITELVVLEGQLHLRIAMERVDHSPRRVDLIPLLPSIQTRTRRLAGPSVEVEWKHGTNLGAVGVEPAQLELALLELVIRARSSLTCGGKLVIEIFNVDLNDRLATECGVNSGSYVLVELKSIRSRASQEAIPILDDVVAYYPDMTEDMRLNVRQILEQNGGTLQEYTEPGKALTLRAYLPSSGTAVGTEEMSQSVQNKIILLVEDEGFVRDVATEILESMGYTVLAAQSGSEAISIFQKQGPIHLLVTDIVMPGMNGRELAKQLTVFQPELKTIFMSGYVNDAIVPHGILGVEYAYLPKPFTMEALGKKVREVLGDST